MESKKRSLDKLPQGSAHYLMRNNTASKVLSECDGNLKNPTFLRFLSD